MYNGKKFVRKRLILNSFVMNGLRFRNEINVRFGWLFPHPYCRPRRVARSVLYAQVKGKDKQQKEEQELPFPDFPSVEEGETGEEQKTPLPNEPENPLPDLPSNHPEEEVRHLEQ